MAYSTAVAPVSQLKYELVTDTHRQIRLLSLLPGQKDDLVRCHLEKAQLDKKPDYEALSYTWGDPTNPVTIECNGVAILVTRSLHGALRHFRRASQQRILWADAICIDKNNLRERTHQMQLMRSIYQQAACVLVWLGEEADGSEEMPSLISRVVREATTLPTAGMMLDNITNPSPETALRSIMMRLPDKENRQWAAFRLLLKRAWLSRVWIVQEVAVAKAVEIHCGKSRLDLVDFSQAAMFSTSAGYFETERQSGVSSLMSLRAMRMYAQLGQRKSLLSLLLQFPSAKASDPKDKVYALLGLSDSNLVPDYELSVTEVYKRAAVHMVKSSQTLELLSFPPGAGERRNSNLPSWVPDWEVLDQRIQQLTMQDFGGPVTNAPDFHAARKHTTMVPEFADNFQMLRLQGCAVDEIEETADKGEPHQTPESKRQEQELYCRTHRWLISWEETARVPEGGQYLNGESVADAYWQTLQGGWCPHGRDFHRTIYERHEKQFAIHRHLHKHGLPQHADGNFADYQHLQAAGIPCAVLLLPIPLHRVLFSKEMFALLPPRKDGQVSRQFYAYCRACVNRCLFRSKKGYIGLAPSAAQPGDTIYVVKGSRIPLVLRPAAPRKFIDQSLNTLPLYQLVGDAYVHGIMYGEAFKEGAKCETFWLV